MADDQQTSILIRGLTLAQKAKLMEEAEAHGFPSVNAYALSKLVGPPPVHELPETVTLTYRGGAQIVTMPIAKRRRR